MMTPLKLGIAVACLVGVAAFIAFDLVTSHREPVAATGSQPAPAEKKVPASVQLPDPGAGRLAEESARRPQVPSGAPGEVARNLGEQKGALAPKGGAPATPPGDKIQNTGSAPVALPQGKVNPPEILPGEQRVYTVVPGDTLYGISIKVFGTPRHYERIYEANKDRIRDPNTLQIGTNLIMPDLPVKPAPVGAGSPGAAPTPAPSESSSPLTGSDPKDLR